MDKDRGRRSIRGFWAIAAALSLGYLVLARSPVGDGPRLEELGVFRLDEARSAGDKIIPVQAGQGFFANRETFGYLSSSGAVQDHFRLEPMAATDGRLLATPEPESGLIELRDLAKGTKIQIPFVGYPFVAGGRLFLLRPDQQAVTEIDRQGRTIWSLEFGTTLTSGSAAGGFSVWGGLGGELTVQRGKGRFETLRPALDGLDSSLPCIYAGAVAPDGGLLTLLYGLRPQYALFYEDSGGGYRLVHKRKIEAATIKTEGAAVSADGSFAVMRTAAGLLVYDRARRSSAIIHPEWFGGAGRECAALACGESTIALLGAEGKDRRLALLRGGVLEACFKVDEDSSGIDYAAGGLLIVSGPTTLRRYRIPEEDR